MLQVISGLPRGVVGIEARGRVTADDYERTLLPAIDAARDAAPDGKVRLLYVLGEDFGGYSAGAAWEDAKLGLSHFGSWERIAVVSDAEWMRGMVAAVGWMVPGEIRTFAVSERPAAEEWLTA